MKQGTAKYLLLLLFVVLMASDHCYAQFRRQKSMQEYQSQNDKNKHGDRDNEEHHPDWERPRVGDTVTAQPVAADKPIREFHQPTAQQWQKLKEEKELGYKNDREIKVQKKPSEQNSFDRLADSFFRFLMSGAGNVVVWIIVILLVGYIAYKLIWSNGNFLFGKSEKSLAKEEVAAPNEEDLATTNWEQLLQNAIASNDLRLAVRFRYMWLLQLLQQANLILYRNDKTNYDYYTELGETQYKKPFKQLSRLYEYAWYGNFELSVGTQDEYISMFDHLKNQLGK